MSTLTAIIRSKRGTSSEWSDADPVLAAGEIGVNTTTGTLKVGDGVSAWSELQALGSGGDGGSNQVVVAFLVDDLDASGGDFTQVQPVDAYGVAHVPPLLREFVVGATVAVYTGDDGGKVFTITESGPCTEGDALVFGQEVVGQDLRDVTGPSTAALAWNADGLGGAADPEAPVDRLRARASASYDEITDVPARSITFVYGMHLGGDDSEASFLEDAPFDTITDGSQYDGQDVYRLQAATIDGQPVEDVQTVIALGSQGNGHNGIWELFHDMHGITGVFCVRTIVWNGSLINTGDGPRSVKAAVPFVIGGGTKYGPDTGSGWGVIDGNGMDSDVKPMGMPTGGGGSGPDLSDANPEDLGIADPGTSPDASRADHVHDMPSAADIGAVPTSRTIAALDLSADRSASDLRTALSLVPGTDVVRQAWNPAPVRKGSDQSVNSSTTLVDVTSMGHAIAASEEWVTEWDLLITGPSAGDASISVTVPSGASLLAEVLGFGSGASAQPSNVMSQQFTTSGTACTVGVFAAGVKVRVRATVVCSSTPGNVQLQFAQQTSNGSDTTVSGMSTMTRRRIA